MTTSPTGLVLVQVFGKGLLGVHNVHCWVLVVWSARSVSCGPIPKLAEMNLQSSLGGEDHGRLGYSHSLQVLCRTFGCA